MPGEDLLHDPALLGCPWGLPGKNTRLLIRDVVRRRQRADDGTAGDAYAEGDAVDVAGDRFGDGDGDEGDRVADWAGVGVRTDGE